MATPDHSVYPQIFGIEEELQLEGRQAGGDWRTVEGDALQNALDAYQDAAATGDPPLRYTQTHGKVQQRNFNSAGDKTYIDCSNAERSTAEVGSIREAIKRSRGVERFAAALAQQLIRLNPELEAIAHRRHVGVFADIVGTQDSIHVPPAPGADPLTHAAKVENMLAALALVRPFMTGAGHYENGQLHFAQKLTNLSNYWAGHDVDLQLVIGGGDRFEIRENDINLCDAMAAMRLGGSAIAATIAQTPLIAGFEDFIDEAMSSKHERRWSDRFNVPVLNPDGTFDTQQNQHLIWAANQHLEIADAFNSGRMHKFAGSQPPELLEIAEKIYRHALLMKRVLRNHAPVQDLASTSEWAAKWAHGSNHRDIDYDSTFYTLDEKGEVVADQAGLGFYLRDSGYFEGTIPAAEVDAAYFTPPANTRAAVRAAVIDSYRTCYAGWNGLAVFRRTRFGTVHPAYLHFNDPRQTELTPHQRKVLQHAVRLESADMAATAAPASPRMRPDSGDAVTEAIYRVIDATSPE
jgi:hypothetical protein